MPNINSRLQEFLKENGLSARQVSLALGKPGGYFSNAFNAGSSISADVISQICEMYHELSPNWLLTGRGDSILQENELQEPETSYSYNNSIDAMIDKKIDERVLKLEKKWISMMKANDKLRDK